MRLATLALGLLTGPLAAQDVPCGGDFGDFVQALRYGLKAQKRRLRPCALPPLP